ncbi:MAG: STAS-like domain-containing protein [Balneolaceae bacterium]|nr:STAS-like domain-containing protein [Balneolaceae bacterium]MCH8550276.1 STAS-like domain-containing protein [Balneolaceae bacterium]
MNRMERIIIKDEIGQTCLNSNEAIKLRISRIEPSLIEFDHIVFDFKKVRNMNSSFTNALFTGLIQEDPKILDKISFENCNGKIKSMIEIALMYGIKRSKNLENV